MEGKSCLVIVDVQKGILKLKQPVYKESDIVKNIKKAINLARKNNIKIFFTQHENRTFLNSGSTDWEIIDEFSLSDNDIIIRKTYPSIFKDTGLYDILEKEHLSKLIIAGLISNGCIKDSCLDALKNNLEVVLLKDAHSTFYKNAKKIINQINMDLEKKGVHLTSTEEPFL